MRVALDVHALQVPGYADRGIGRYVIGYARALARRDAVAVALLAPELPPAAGMPGELVTAGRVRWDAQPTVRDLLSEPGPPVVYHVTAPFLHAGPGEPAALGVVEHWTRAGVARAVLLHDLIPLRAPRHYLPSPAHKDRYRARAEWVAESDVILTNSEYTRREAIEVLGARPDRVVTVGAGVSGYFGPADGTDGELWAHHLGRLRGRPYVLTVGGSDVRKATDRAIAAFAQVLRRGFDGALVVVGHLTAEWERDLRDTARASGIEDRVIFLGAVGDELLRACYRRAQLTVMPSLAEGAGLPVLESAACGTPAVASATTALAETAVTGEALFDPADTDSVAETLGAVLEDPGRQARILEAQAAMARAATWESVADRALEALTAAGRTAGTGGYPDPLRLALVSSGDPDPAGLERAATALASGGRAEITPVGWRPQRPPSSGPAPDLPVALAAFGPDVRPSSFDHVVYRLGPNPDARLERLARRYPGWIWMGGGTSDHRRAAALAGCSRGFLVESAEAARALELALTPLRPHPPVAVVPGPTEGGADADQELAAAVHRVLAGLEVAAGAGR